VLRVCLVDADRQMVTVFASDQPEVQLTGEQLLTLPEILPGWSVSIAQFFQ
jgi:Uma2 family endonuclease